MFRYSFFYKLLCSQNKTIFLQVERIRECHVHSWLVNGRVLELSDHWRAAGRSGQSRLVSGQVGHADRPLRQTGGQFVAVKRPADRGGRLPYVTVNVLQPFAVLGQHGVCARPATHPRPSTHLIPANTTP